MIQPLRLILLLLQWALVFCLRLLFCKHFHFVWFSVRHITHRRGWHKNRSVLWRMPENLRGEHVHSILYYNIIPTIILPIRVCALFFLSEFLSIMRQWLLQRVFVSSQHKRIHCTNWRSYAHGQRRFVNLGPKVWRRVQRQFKSNDDRRWFSVVTNINI